MNKSINLIKKSLSIERNKQSAIIGFSLIIALVLSILFLPFIIALTGEFNGFLVYYALLFILAFTGIIWLLKIEEKIKELKKELNDLIELL